VQASQQDMSILHEKDGFMNCYHYFVSVFSVELVEFLIFEGFA